MQKNIKSELYGKVIHGDLTGMLDLLKKNQSDPKNKLIYKKLKNRFVTKSEPFKVRCKNEFVKAISIAYQSYYRLLLSKVKNVSSSEKHLLSELNKILFRYNFSKVSFTNLDDFEKFVPKELEQIGYFGIFGHIAQFRCALIWSKQETKAFRIQLPQGMQQVKVVFISKFILQSWMNYLSLGKVDLGGWAAADCLYCLKKHYKSGSERFQINYLKHEAQHFADYKLFPKIKLEDYSPRNMEKLEFRAKLVELIYVKRPNQLIRAFIRQMRNDPNHGHPYGAYRIVEGFKKRFKLSEIKSPADWKTLDIQEIKKTAEALLLDDKLVLKRK